MFHEEAALYYWGKRCVWVGGWEGGWALTLYNIVTSAKYPNHSKNILLRVIQTVNRIIQAPTTICQSKLESSKCPRGGVKLYWPARARAIEVQWSELSSRSDSVPMGHVSFRFSFLLTSPDRPYRRLVLKSQHRYINYFPQMRWSSGGKGVGVVET